MTLSTRTATRSLTLLLAVVSFLFVACSGGSGGGDGPTAPAATATFSNMSVSTSGGTLAVVSYGCGDSLDLKRMEREVYTTASIAERQDAKKFGAGSLLDGFEIHARTAADSKGRCDGNAACFERTSNGGRLHVICDGGGLEHETAHALAWAARLDCWQNVYHSRNFRCEQTTNLYGA